MVAETKILSVISDYSLHTV